MRLCRIVVGVLWLLLPAISAGQDSKLNWDWRNQEVIGRTDPSVGNTSALTEPERSSLMDAIVLRLQKPMSDAGYDDDRIREIASTTRIRFVDLGDGKPLLLATSLGLEGGCDAMANCPLWIFRRTDEGFLSLLAAIAASYTVQPREGEAASDLVLMHHITSLRSGLRVYHYADFKLVDAGCFEANWPKPTGDPTQSSDPDIQPCNEERLNQYGLPVVKPLHPHPDEKLAHPVAIVPAPQQPAAPAAEAPQAEPPKEQAPAQEAPASEAPTAEQPKEAAPAANGAPSTEPAKEPAAPAEPGAPAATAEPAPPDAPKSEPSQPGAEQKSSDAPLAPNQEQAPPAKSEPSSEKEAPSKPEEPPASEQQPPASNPDQPKSDQAQPSKAPQAPDAGQNAPATKGDEPQPAPDAQQPPASQEQPKTDQAPPDQQAPNPDTSQPPAGDKEPTPKQEQPSGNPASGGAAPSQS